ncbi:BTAD domain-containing putative transcriptional regulator [Cellulomonas sp. 73-92]|uniref:AfsR/SARP family transcriptional regulator n=1 Tax=Cellulomonas sp. 73-92 TaxID=1895740 RepID=UPI000AA735B6|nr:BTAD domain-containing putative transcriptional regulator [Cellulomonas sp. 73-92]
MPAPDASPTPPVRVLGPVLVAGPDGVPQSPRGVRAAALVATLALADGAPVPVPGLVDRLWPDEAPADPRAALHNLVSRLRQATAPDAVRSVPTGYALGCASDLSLARGALALGRAALGAGRAEEAGRLATSALGLWRGEPGLDLGAVGVELRATAARLHEDLALLRREAAEAAGDDATVAVLASDALAADPLDEDAARSLMTALAAQGRGAEAVRVYGRLRHALVAELGTDPAPDLVALHDRLLAAAEDQVPVGAPLRRGGGGAADASSDTTPGRVRHVALGLRAAPNPLVGRDVDVADVESALRTSRLVTVLGAGGLGKTRLAQEVARRAMTATPLVVVVELAGVRSDDDVVLALADTLGLAAGATARLGDRLLAGDVHDQVLARLRGTTSLVVLDNCEHVVAGAARWAHELLGAVPELRILATSRAPLRLTAEQTFPLAPLAADGTGAPTGPAVELFRQRARAARPDVRLPDDVVVRLCDRLDGLPLAIELAAARVRTLSVEEIEQHLDERFALLRSGDAAAPDRHRTLEAVIEWSWNLLTATQQALWRRVAILPDGFGVDAAAAIGGLGTASPLDVLDDVDGLVTQSLLAVTDDGGVARYRMLETVREFGLLRLAAAGEQDAVRDALLDWAAELARRDVAVLLGPGQVGAIAELVRDQENLLYAFRTAAETPPEGAHARRPEVVVHTFVGLAASWALRGSEERAAGLAATVLGSLRGWPVPDEDADVTAVALTFTLGALVTGGTSAGDVGASRARTMARLRLLLRRPRLGRRTRALLSLVLLPDWGAMVREVQDLQRDPDPLVAFAACICAGQGAENDGQLEQALRDAEEAYARSVGIGDVACPAFAAMFVATTASELGDFATALAWTDRVRPGFATLGATSALRQLDWIELSVALEAGDVEAAEALCDRLEVPGEWPDERGGAEMAAVAGAGRGEVALLRGDAEAAVGRYADVMRAFGDVQGPGTPWAVMLGSAQVVRLVGLDHLDEARDALARLGRRAVALYRDRMSQFLDRPVLGTACLAAGTFRAATGDRAPGVADLFALAEAIGSRQDVPALRRAPLLATAASLLGAGALDEGRARVAAMTHDAVTEHALALLDEVAGEGGRG